MTEIDLELKPSHSRTCAVKCMLYDNDLFLAAICSFSPLHNYLEHLLCSINSIKFKELLIIKQLIMIASPEKIKKNRLSCTLGTFIFTVKVFAIAQCLLKHIIKTFPFLIIYNLFYFT